MSSAELISELRSLKNSKNSAGSDDGLELLWAAISGLSLFLPCSGRSQRERASSSSSSSSSSSFGGLCVYVIQLLLPKSLKQFKYSSKSKKLNLKNLTLVHCL
uniref:Uncharacterized protein n=1 Tax=Populus davidiana TaxID=266767 RepID=A0A6M2EFJ6_9ROSI